MKSISKLHYITTSASLAEQACKGGVDWIQLRLKNTTYDEYYFIAKEVKEICRTYNAIFIINDNVQLAKDINADGVHLGKEDMSPAAARALLGDNYIIGCTANTTEDILQLTRTPVDYIGLGPYRFTGTKENLSPILGIEGYKRVFTELPEKLNTPPVIGIGGILENDVVELLSTGLYGIAVSGAISNAKDITVAAKTFKEHFSYSFQ
jgi:thiamine-phosphate pyrophosphorylase